MNKKTAVVVLAAGYGKRLGGENQKTLTRILGRPILSYLISTLKNCCPDRIIIVVGFQKEKVMEELKEEPVVFVEQPVLLGTGHAVMMTEKALNDFQGNVLVLCGDVPFLSFNTLRELEKVHQETDASCTLLTAFVENPKGYGRIIRDKTGEVIRIVEEINATEEEKKIKEINAGVYIFDKDALFDSLKKLRLDPVKKEYYLTDVIALLIENGKRVSSWTTPAPEETIGINTPEDLKKAEEYLLQIRSKA